MFRAAIVAIAMGLLCACMGAPHFTPVTSVVQQNVGRSSLAPTTAIADVFVISGARVLGYAHTRRGRVIELKGIVEPGGIAFDSKHDLYVSDEDQKEILAYAPGSASPFRTIAMPASFTPFGVAVDRDDHVWVGTYSTMGPGNLTEFGPAGTVKQFIQCKGQTDYTGPITADATGDVFMQFASVQQQQGIVEEVVAGHHACTALPPRYWAPGGLAVTRTGALVVGDFYNYDAFTYESPAFRKIIARTNLGGGNRKGANNPDAIALTSDNTGIWTATVVGGPPHAVLYRYPHGGAAHVERIGLVRGASAIAVDY